MAMLRDTGSVCSETRKDGKVQYETKTKIKMWRFSHRPTEVNCTAACQLSRRQPINDDDDENWTNQAPPTLPVLPRDY